MRHSGSSPAEVLLVVALVALMAGVAIPSWQAWVLRGQIEHGVTVASTSFDEIEAFYSARGRLPRHSGEAGLAIESSDGSVEYVSWRRSANDPDNVGYLDVQMKLQPLGSGVTPIILEARVDGKALKWRCVSARQMGIAEEVTVADFYLPSHCRQGAEMPDR